MGSDQTTAKALPIIHFNSQNLSPASSSWLATSQLVRSALESHGCFVAAVHHETIPLEMHQKMFDFLKDLFDMPLEIKVQNTSEYLGFGYGANFPIMPLIEYLGITNAATLEATKDFTNLIWPDGNEPFCETAYWYSRQLLELKNAVLRMALESYGVEKYHDVLDQSAFHLMRFMKYRTANENEINVGLQPHVDKTFLSVVHTNHVKGLEFETKDGEHWIGFDPAPSAFLVIAGEGFTAWSNGRVFAPLHQVVMGGDEEKYSIGLFSFMHGTLETPVEFVDEQNPLQFKPFDNVAYLDYCGGQKLKPKRAIKDFCGIY